MLRNCTHVFLRSQAVMNVLFACLLLAALAALSEPSLDFSIKGDPCSELDRCDSKSAARTCSCDGDCHLYGTCCQDKPPRDDAAAAVHGFQCRSRRTVHPVFAKRSCPDDYRGHVGTKLACLEEEEDEMDVKNNQLVTSRQTKITYWNRQCARCNGEADLEFWNTLVLCPSRKEVDGSLIRRNLTFHQDKLQWGLEIGGEFLPCSVQYSPPPYIEEVRHCIPNIVASCPAKYRNKEILAKCSQYYAERRLKNSETYFRNVHCAICNGVDPKDLECPGMSVPGEDVDESDFREMVEEVFYDGEWLEKEAGKMFECSKGYAYDPFREKCRVFEVKTEEPTISNSAPAYGGGYLTLTVAVATLLLKMLLSGS